MPSQIVSGLALFAELTTALSVHTLASNGQRPSRDRAPMVSAQLTVCCRYVGTNRFSGTVPTQFSALSKLFGWCAAPPACRLQSPRICTVSGSDDRPHSSTRTSRGEGARRDWSENQLDGTVPAQFSVLRNLQQL